MEFSLYDFQQIFLILSMRTEKLHTHYIKQYIICYQNILNRYTLLHKGTKYCTAIDFPTLNFVVVAYADCSVKVIDSGELQLCCRIFAETNTLVHAHQSNEKFWSNAYL